MLHSIVMIISKFRNSLINFLFKLLESIIIIYTSKKFYIIYLFFPNISYIFSISSFRYIFMKLKSENPKKKKKNSYWTVILTTCLTRKHDIRIRLEFSLCKIYSKNIFTLMRFVHVRRAIHIFDFSREKCFFRRNRSKIHHDSNYQIILHT